MKTFEVHVISQELPDQELNNVSALLDGLNTRQYIDNVLWSVNDYVPQVSFSMAYDQGFIFIKYTVAEEYIKAVYRELNDPVYKDTCVEFFIAFNNDSSYYNFEFNCIGTALAGYGPGKTNRISLEKENIKKMKTSSLIKSPGDEQNGLINWELTVAIPFEAFAYHQITSLKQMPCRANFYKCGDELPKPHYLSWNNIINPDPNFHLPEFFGQVNFV